VIRLAGTYCPTSTSCIGIRQTCCLAPFWLRLAPGSIGPLRATVSLVVLTWLVLGLFRANLGLSWLGLNFAVHSANDGAFGRRLDVLHEDTVRIPGLYSVLHTV
jgi:hypothetical protein